MKNNATFQLFFELKFPNWIHQSNSKIAGQERKEIRGPASTQLNESAAITSKYYLFQHLIPIVFNPFIQ